MAVRLRFQRTVGRSYSGLIARRLDILTLRTSNIWSWRGCRQPSHRFRNYMSPEEGRLTSCPPRPDQEAA